MNIFEIINNNRSDLRAIDWANTIKEATGKDILFLTVAGSRLYGTTISDKSDLDIRGIFDGDDDKAISLVTNDDGKNSCEDIDFTLMSIKRFEESLQKEDPNAVALLYAPTNADCVLFMSERYPYIADAKSFVERGIVNPFSLNGTSAYILSEMKKFGFVGTNIYTLEFILRWLMDKNAQPFDKLEVYVENLIRDFQASLIGFTTDETGRPTNMKMTTVTKTNGAKLLSINFSKSYDFNSKVSYFIKEIEKWLAQYDKETVDFKCPAQAYRGIVQQRLLLEEGIITFPLPEADADIIKKIKMQLMDKDLIADRLKSSYMELIQLLNAKSNRKE